jgi:hypothetical protein
MDTKLIRNISPNPPQSRSTSATSNQLSATTISRIAAPTPASIASQEASFHSTYSISSFDFSNASSASRAAARAPRLGPSDLSTLSEHSRIILFDERHSSEVAPPTKDIVVHVDQQTVDPSGLPLGRQHYTVDPSGLPLGRQQSNADSSVFPSSRGR